MKTTGKSKSKINYRQGIIIALISSVATIIAALISSGQFTKKAEAEGKDNPTLYCEEHSQRITFLEQELQNSIKLSALSDISSSYFERGAEKDKLKGQIQRLISEHDEFQREKAHYTYQLFSLRRKMLEMPRGNINTRIEGIDPETIKLIQGLLKGVEFYDGEIDGDRTKAYKAVRGFQKKINKYSSGYIDKENYGIIGKATFAALLDLYENNN
jgi:hypothetical protein